MRRRRKHEARHRSDLKNSTRLKTATRSSCSVDARLMRGAAFIGMGGLSVSRPSLMNTTRCSVTWHSEQTNVWCSTPGRATVSSGIRSLGSTQRRHALTTHHSLPPGTPVEDVGNMMLRYEGTLWIKLVHAGTKPHLPGSHRYQATISRRACTILA